MIKDFTTSSYTYELSEGENNVNQEKSKNGGVCAGSDDLRVPACRLCRQQQFG